MGLVRSIILGVAIMFTYKHNIFILDLVISKTNVIPIKHIEAEQNGYHFADDIFNCIFLNIKLSNFK